MSTATEPDADFAAYFAGQVSSVRRIAFALCGDWHTADDLAQMTFVKLYPQWRRVRGGSVDAYVRRVLVNTYLSHVRKHRREKVVAEVPDAAAWQADTHDDLSQALRRLPAQQRAVVVLRHLEDLSIGPSWSTLDPAPYCATASAEPTSPLVKPTTVVNEKNNYPIRIPAEPADHAAARISCYLATAVPPLLPDVAYHWSSSALAGTLPLQAYPGRVFDPARPADTTPPYFTADAVITDDQGAGTIGFGAGPAYETAADATANCAGICTVRSGPHGETVTVLDTTTASGYHHVEVHVYRGDTIASASAENGVTPPTAPGEAISSDELKPARHDLPLTIEQLIELACAPELDLFP